MSNSTARRVPAVRMAVRPLSCRYSGTADGAAAFARLLRSRAAIRRQPVRAVADLCLNARTGRTERGYRYTTSALAQVCSKLAPGLGQLVRDIADTSRSDSRHVSHSLEAATAIFNRCLLLRADRLRGAYLLLDVTAGVIEGCVGGNYRLLSNESFWERTQEFLADLDWPVVFQGAAYWNRHVSFRYRAVEPIFTVGDDAFHAGWEFSNAEISGCAVAICGVLWRQASNSSALVSFPALKPVAHRAGEFDSRLAALFAAARAIPAQLSVYRTRLEQFRNRRLLRGVGEAEIGQTFAKIRHQCRKAGLSKAASRAIAVRALLGFVGDASSPCTFAEMRQVADTSRLSFRTYYDFYNAIGEIARTLSCDQQSKVEKFAGMFLARTTRASAVTENGR